MALIRKVASLCLEYDARRMIAACMLAAISAMLPIGLPLLFGITIDRLLSHVPPLHLAPLLAVMVLLTTASAAATVVSSRMSISLGYGICQRLSHRLYASLLRMPYLTYATINNGVLASRLTNDLRMIEPLFVEVSVAALRGWAALLGTAIVLAFTAPWFLLIFLVVPLSLAVVRYSEAQIDDTIGQSFGFAARVSEVIHNTMNGDAISLIRQARSTGAETIAYDQVTKAASEVATSLDFWRANVRSAYDISFGLMSVSVLALGATLSAWGYTSIGSVISSLLYLSLLRQPLSDLIGLRYPILRGSIGLKRVEEVLQSPNTGLNTVALPPNLSTSKRESQPSSTSGGRNVLCFRSVWFKYPHPTEIAVEGLSHLNSAQGALGFAGSISLTTLTPKTDERDLGHNEGGWALVDISFSLNRGQTVAVSGVSGAGKSTIVGLACGLIRPTRGRILMNGRDTAQLSEEEMWGSISLVSQDIYLRNGTLRENLAYGHDDATEVDLIEACQKAGLSELLSRLPAGLDTHVGSRGKRFSGGERQRISLARAFLSNGDLLVLDEATSHLDTAKEADVLASLDALRAKKAILVVAHRVSAVSRSDSVIMIENGTVVEAGTHLDLLGAGGRYALMHSASEQRTKSPQSPS